MKSNAEVRSAEFGLRHRASTSFVIHHSIIHHFRLPPSAFSSILPPPARGTWRSTRRCWRPRRPRANARCGSISWEEPTLSLGYFQTYADRWQHEASRECAGGPSPERRRGHPARRRTDLQPRGPRAPSAGRQPAADVSSRSSGPDRGAGRWGIEAGMLTCSTAARPCERPEPRCPNASERLQRRIASLALQRAARAVPLLPTAVAG